MFRRRVGALGTQSTNPSLSFVTDHLLGVYPRTRLVVDHQGSHRPSPPRRAPSAQAKSGQQSLLQLLSHSAREGRARTQAGGDGAERHIHAIVERGGRFDGRDDAQYPQKPLLYRRGASSSPFGRRPQHCWPSLGGTIVLEVTSARFGGVESTGNRLSAPLHHRELVPIGFFDVE